MTEKTVSTLLDMLTVTDTKLADLSSLTSAPDVSHQIDALRQKYAEAEKIKDETERNIRLKILEANFTKLRAGLDKEKGDLAQAMTSLDDILTGLGQEYANLSKPTAEDEEEIADAKADVAASEKKLADLGDAFFFKGSRTRKADELVKLARELLAAKIAEVQQRVRTRLQSASIEQTLQDFQVRVDKVIKIMETRLRQIDVQVKAVTERKGIAFDLKGQAAEALEKLDADLATAETDLVTEQELLLTLVANTPEYQNQDKKVSLLKARAEDVSGRRNAALAVLQVKEKFSRELEAHEIAQRKMFAIQRLWILQLRAEAEERVVTFRSRLEAMQTMSDQEVAKHLTDMGAVIDQSNIEYMVMTQEACIKNVEDKFAQYPEHLRKIKEAQEAQAESITRAKEHMDEYVRMYKEQFGDEPDIGFFFKNPIGDEKSAGTPAAKKEQEASSVDDLLKL